MGNVAAAAKNPAQGSVPLHDSRFGTRRFLWSVVMKFSEKEPLARLQRTMSQAKVLGQNENPRGEFTSQAGHGERKSKHA